MRAANIVSLSLAVGLCLLQANVGHAVTSPPSGDLPNSDSPDSEALAWAERPDEEVYVFGLQLDRFNLTEGLIVFYDGERAFVPLGGFAKALEFPIAVDPENGTALGWFLNDDRAFELDMRAGKVRFRDRVMPLNPDNIERHPDDLYVAMTELEDWFPVLLDLRFRRLQISVKALEPLPLQERAARIERRSRLRRIAAEEEMERVDADAGWFEWPFVDTSIEASGRSRAEEHLGQARMTTTVAGVFGGLDGEATAIMDSDQDAPNFRVRLSRQSLDGGLLGPLDAREFALGDVTTPDLPLIAENAVGRGIEISTFDLDRLEQTNRVTLRGELPVGWEVEVYRNGELIDFQSEQDVGDGRYEFSGLPTLAGLNEFRLVFFGPQGQTREQVERYFVTPELSKPRRSSFRFAYNQLNRDLISTDPKERRAQDDGEHRLILQGEHGLSETLSVSGGLASLSVEGDRLNYAIAGLQSSLHGVLGQLDIAVEDSGGFAVGGRAQTQLGSWSVFAEQSWFQDFHSEQTDDGRVQGHLRSRSVARINGHVPDFGLGHQPLSATLTHEESEEGEWQTNLFGRISSVVRPFNFSLSSNARVREGEEVESDLRLLVGTLLGDFRLRGEVGYDIAPDAEFDQVSLSADWRINQYFGARVGLRHIAGDSELTTATAGINRQFDTFALGINLEADSRGDYNARLGLSFALGHNPAADRLEMRAKPFARRGAISTRVFLDRDNDGVFSKGDEVIENAGFTGPRVRREVKTEADGTAFMVGMEPYREIEIGLSEATLEDPYWASANGPRLVTTRPGVTTHLEFPVVETGEVDGVIILREALREGDEGVGAKLDISGAPAETGEPGAGLRVLLVDEEGQVVAETMSAYDGFFIFSRIPYGLYHLMLDSEQMQALGYAKGPSREFEIRPDEPYASGLDLIAKAMP